MDFVREQQGRLFRRQGTGWGRWVENYWEKSLEGRGILAKLTWQDFCWRQAWVIRDQGWGVEGAGCWGIWPDILGDQTLNLKKNTFTLITALLLLTVSGPPPPILRIPTGCPTIQFWHKLMPERCYQNPGSCSWGRSMNFANTQAASKQRLYYRKANSSQDRLGGGRRVPFFIVL